MDIVRQNEIKKSHLETPVKKGKSQYRSQIKTAESIELVSSPTIKDIEAEELFENFNRIVKVTEVEDDSEEMPNPYKKIDFESQANSKLNFDQSTASMKKKNQPKKEYMKDGLKIRPFILLQETKNTEAQFQSPKCSKKDSKEVTTPTRKPLRSEDLMMAARKQDPFRDLSNQKK